MNEGRPLRGRRILLTRGVEKADRLAGLLEAEGAVVLHVPLIAVERLAPAPALAAAVDRLRGGVGPARPWLVLTSETAVALVLEAVGAAGLEGVATAVVGPASAAALQARGIDPALVARGQDAESLAQDLSLNDVAGVPTLVITAAGGRGVVAPAMLAAGARVEVLEAYRSIMPADAPARLAAALAIPRPDAIVFTSGSTVLHFMKALGPGQPPPDLPALCIGPVTERAAREAGWRTVVTGSERTSAALAAAALKLLTAAQPLP